MDKREIILVDADGSPIRSMDVSDLDNANAQEPITLHVSTRCDMGAWHDGQVVEVTPWGPKIP